MKNQILCDEKKNDKTISYPLKHVVNTQIHRGIFEKQIPKYVSWNH